MDTTRNLETFMGLEQKNGAGSTACIPRVVSKSDSDHGTATTAHRTLGLMPVGTFCHSNLSLSHYPIHSSHTDQSFQYVLITEIFSKSLVRVIGKVLLIKFS